MLRLQNAEGRESLVGVARLVVAVCLCESEASSLGLDRQRADGRKFQGRTTVTVISR